MKEEKIIYKEKVKQILFRDYIEQDETSIQIVESVLAKISLEWYILQGYSEEATANEIYENELFCYKNNTG